MGLQRCTKTANILLFPAPNQGREYAFMALAIGWVNFLLLKIKYFYKYKLFGIS